VDGVIVGIDKEGVLVNVGQKSEGLVPLREMRSLGTNGLAQVKMGKEVLVCVLRTSDEEGGLLLSIDRAREETGWRTLEKALESGEVISGEVTTFNRGGLIVDIQGVQAFVPVSQVASMERTIASSAEDSPLAKLVGTKLSFKVLELNRKRNRVILSERAALQEWRDQQKAKLLAELQEGEVRKGRITGISGFGAFVDLGGADGLIHISELSWTPVASPEEVVKVGEDVDVYVLKVDRENKKIGLSLRRLRAEPWDNFVETAILGDVVKGVVTRLTPFGAFVRLESGVEGLIHISELADRPIRHPKEVVKEGEEVKVKILRIERDRRRLGLTLRQMEEDDNAISDALDDYRAPTAASYIAGESHG